VLWDEDQATCRRYRVNLYPTALLIGPDGKILWRGIPSASQAASLEAKIREALEQVDVEALRAAGSPFLPAAAPEEAE
jgi:hypothetical protein